MDRPTCAMLIFIVSRLKIWQIWGNLGKLRETSKGSYELDWIFIPLPLFYFQVDLQFDHTITGIVVQGASFRIFHFFVEEFQIETKKQGTEYKYIKDSYGHRKVRSTKIQPFLIAVYQWHFILYLFFCPKKLMIFVDALHIIHKNPHVWTICIWLYALCVTWIF